MEVSHIYWRVFHQDGTSGWNFNCCIAMSLPNEFFDAVKPYLFIAVAFALIHTIYRQTRIYFFCKAHNCQKPRPMATGFLGLPALRDVIAAMWDGRMLEFFGTNIEETGGETYSLNVANKLILFTIDPENIKAILATQFNEFVLGSRHAYFLPLLGDGIFTLDSHGWKNSRAMLRPQFSREQIAHVKSLEPHLQTLASHVRKANGAVFDLQELFFRFTVDTATDILFGESVYCLRDGTVPELPPHDEFEGREIFGEAFNVAQKYLATRSYAQSFYFLINTPSFRRSCKAVHAFARFYVNKAILMDDDELEKKSQSGYTFLYELAKQTKDAKVLQDQLLNIMVAGRDTTAGLMSFTFFELSRHPEVYARLREEVLALFGEGTPQDLENITFESLKKCEYLKWVLNETLRLYPSVAVNFRDSTKDTTLPRGGGPDGNAPVFVPKGTTVGYSVYFTHRLKEYYGEDAEEFRPERWAENQRLGWAYLPFNGGPRICLGQQFALTEASYVVVRLIQMFPNLASAYDGPLPPKKMLHLTMSMFDGVPVTMT